MTNATFIAHGTRAVFALLTPNELHDTRRLMADAVGVFGTAWHAARLAEIDAEMARRGGGL